MSIRRPLYYIAAAFCAAVFLTHVYKLIVPAVILAAIIYACRRERGRDQRYVLILAAAGFAAGLLLMLCAELAYDPAEKAAGENTVIVGTVLGSETKLRTDDTRKAVITMKAEQIITGQDTIKVRDRIFKPDCRVLVSCDAETPGKDPPVPGDRIRVRGKLKLPAGKRNPQCFDYSLYLKGCGIRTVLWTERIEVCRRRGTIRGRIFLFRERFLQRVEYNTDEETAAMIRAILFGGTGLLEEEVTDQFRRNGTAHILAVSGLHIGMIYALLLRLRGLLKPLLSAGTGRREPHVFFICCAAFFSAYLAAADFTPSAVRAVCMILMHALAQMNGRRYDLSTAALAVGIVSIAVNPWILFQSGFQMSFLAVLTIGLITPYIRTVYSGVLLSGAAVQAGLLPYMIRGFGVMTPAALFINIPVVFLTGLIVPAGITAMALPVLQRQADLLLSGLCGILIRTNSLLEIRGISSFPAAAPPPWVIVMWYVFLAAFASEEGRLLLISRDRKRLRRRVAAAAAAVILIGTGCDDGFRSMDVVFADVGQGDCMHIRTCGRNYLIDGGGNTDYQVGKKTLKPYLLGSGVSKIDGAFVTHLHTDHYRGICELAREGMIRRIYVYEANRLRLDQITEETGLSPERITWLCRGQRVTLSRDASLTVLWPERKSAEEYRRMIADDSDENASSLLMKVRVRGVDILATGDMEKEGEQEVLRSGADPGAQILKAGHHGSATSTSEAFLDAVSPQISVIQVGENNLYGHPRPEVLERLKARGIPVFRNDRQGAVGIRIRHGGIEAVRVMLPVPKTMYKKQRQ